MRLPSTLTLLALGLAAVTASHAGINDFKFSTNQTGFVFSTNPNWYLGAFTYAGNTYNAGSTFNLTTLPSGYYQPATDTTSFPGDNVVYNFYRQNYSTVVANVRNGSSDHSYVRDVVGQNTTASALPTTGTFYYTGHSFMQNATGDLGNFNYEINLANKKGKGSFSNLRVNTTYGIVRAKGNLSEQTLTTQADGTFGVKGAAATGITTNNALVNLLIPTSGHKYDIGVFGPNGEEVAGRIYGSGSGLIKGAGIAAKR